MKELVLREINAGMDVRRVARRFGLTASEVRSMVLRPVAAASYRPVSEDGWGPAHLRPYAIGRRGINYGGWKGNPALAQGSFEDALAAARTLYDTGWADMFQKRDGDWMVLYLFRRAERDPARRVYFARPAGEETPSHPA